MVVSEETKRKISESRIGLKNWNYGKPISEGLRGALTGENNHIWKGDNVGYLALHAWVARNLGKPSLCEHCGANNLRPRQYHWANKSGEYKRSLEDWLRLCVKCHKQY